MIKKSKHTNAKTSKHTQKDKKNNLQNNQKINKMANSKSLPINNYFKSKQIKLLNQKI